MRFHIRARHVLSAVLGLAVGSLFLWLALRDVDAAALRAALVAVDGRTLTLAAALYWLAMGLRVLRWQRLLCQLAPAPLHLVAETLVVGYAVNNVLPARLGEVARAAYAKRRLGIGRARVFGSIVIERVLDLGAIIACLGLGLLAQRRTAGAGQLPTFELIALNAGVLIGLAALAIAILRSGHLGRLPLPAPLRAVLRDFAAGMAALNARTALQAALLSAAVWLFEVLALMTVFRACAIGLTAGQGMLVMGAASLSTLVPTAPGYLGSYQLVFVLAMGAFGLATVGGIVASTAIQFVLFGSVTVAGLAVLGLRAARRLRRRRAQSLSENGVKSVVSS